ITVTFSGITFSAKGFGGGITDMAVHSPGAVKATVVFNDCTFTNCEGKDGGALLAYDTVNYQFNNCTFISNKANRGGAVAVKNGGEPLFNGCTFIGNEADDYGSAVVVINNYLSYVREVKIIDSVFKRNLVHSKNGSLAGALACVELNQNIPANETYSKSLGKVFVDNCVFEENIAVIGGLRYPIGSAVSTENMEITLKNTTFKNNANAGSGTIGVMFPTAEPKFNVENVTVENNYVQVSGGSIYFYSTSFFEFKPINSTFGKNYSANGNEIVSLGTLENGNSTVVLTPVGNSVVHEKGYLTSQYPKATLNPLPSIIAVVLVLGLGVVGVYLLYRFNPKNILGKVGNATKVEEETAQE
ncbi:MAG: hypothetical protein IKC64_01110, partial [Clostridia bacterium]|nr:hypothetical protein [Clostridia bacterium]